jgi:hypothetical protein
MNVNPINRQIQDASLLVTQALPAQNTTAASTGSLNLGSAVAGIGTEKADFLLSIPATPSLANGQTITCTVQDSADNVTFAALAGVGQLIVTGAGGIGAAAASILAQLPPGTRAFVNVTVTTSATAGNNTAVSYTFQLLF